MNIKEISPRAPYRAPMIELPVIGFNELMCTSPEPGGLEKSEDEDWVI